MRKYEFQLMLLIIWYMFTLKANALGATQAIYSIPFQMQGNYIVLKATVNNAKLDTAIFLFDTGATGSIIDSTFAAKNNIKSKLSGAMTITASGPVKIRSAKIKSLKFDDKNILTKNIDFSVIDLSNFKSLNIQGIIGYDLLSRYCISVNYDKRCMEFYSFNDYKGPNDYEKYKFELSDFVQIPKFSISFTTYTEEEFTGDILFDTGADLNILFSQSFLEENNLMEKLNSTGPVDTAKSLNNLPITLKTGAIKKLNIGSLEFKDIVIKLPSNNAGSFSFPNFMGILGAEAICKMNFILDYSKQLLYLKASSN